MPALNPASRALIVPVAIGSMVLCGAPAQADNVIGGGTQTPPPKKDVHGDSDGGTLSSTAGVVVFDRSNNGSGQSAGPVTSLDDWTPPACYYAPKYTPEQLQKYYGAHMGSRLDRLRVGQ